jgi:hypothetical protein
MICANCEGSFDSTFCPTCGQKADIHRITVSTVFHDFIHAFTHADKGFLLLVKKLITQPGIVGREYVAGKRKKYFNPLSFLVITSAIHAYATYSSGYFNSTSSGQQGGGGRRMPELVVEAFQVSNGNGKTLSLILIAPLLACYSWLFFRRSKYTPAETFVLNSFIIGESNMIRVLIFIPLFLLFPGTAQLNLAAFEFLLLIYLVVAYRQFFQQNIFLTILKSVFMLILFIVSYWVFIIGYVFLKHLVI